MTAPALITLAHGSRDPRSAATIKALTEQVACLRPDLRVEPAFLDLAEPSFDQTVDRLVAEGHDEIVVVNAPQSFEPPEDTFECRPIALRAREAGRGLERPFQERVQTAGKLFLLAR